MGNVNWGRWVICSIVAGVIVFVAEGLASFLYQQEMEARMSELGLQMEMSLSTMLWPTLLCLITGGFMMLFYVMVRARMGGGPATALFCGFVVPLGTFLPTLLGYHMMGMFRPGLLVLWFFIGLVETVIACLVGGFLYRED